MMNISKIPSFHINETLKNIHEKRINTSNFNQPRETN